MSKSVFHLPFGSPGHAVGLQTRNADDTYGDKAADGPLARRDSLVAAAPSGAAASLDDAAGGEYLDDRLRLAE